MEQKAHNIQQSVAVSRERVEGFAFPTIIHHHTRQYVVSLVSPLSVCLGKETEEQSERGKRKRQLRVISDCTYVIIKGNAFSRRLCAVSYQRAALAFGG